MKTLFISRCTSCNTRFKRESLSPSKCPNCATVHVVDVRTTGADYGRELAPIAGSRGDE